MDTLALWSLEFDQQLTAVDFGSQPPGSSNDLPVRVVNLSAQYNAEAVTAALDSTGDGAQLLLSLDGETFTTSLDLGAIPAGAASQALYIRRSTPTAAPTGARTGHLLVTAVWTDPAVIA